MQVVKCVCGENVYLEIGGSKPCYYCGIRISIEYPSGNAFADGGVWVHQPLSRPTKHTPDAPQAQSESDEN